MGSPQLLLGLVSLTCILLGCAANPATEKANFAPTLASDPRSSPLESQARVEGRLFFLSGLSGDGSSELYSVADADTSPIRIPLTGFTSQPSALSSDGGQLAYVTVCHGQESITVAKADGSKPISVWGWPDVDRIDALAWSPDQERLVFSGRRAGNTDLFIIGPDSGEVILLTSDPLFEADPAWSPDGQQLVYTASAAEGSPASLYIVDLAQREAVRLTDGQMDSSRPQWSPNGQQLVFTAHAPGDTTE